MLDGISTWSLLRSVRRLFGERAPRIQYECRRCGHSPSGPRERCPECGAAEMARYEL